MNLDRTQFFRAVRAKAMICFEIAVVTVTLIWALFWIVVGVSFVAGLLAVYWVGVLGLAAAVSVIALARKLLRVRARYPPRNR